MEKDKNQGSLASRYGETASAGNKVVPGNYGFLYVNSSVIKRLSRYLGRAEWKRVGSVSLVVKPAGQYLQVTDFNFVVLSLIPLSKVVGA